MPTKGNIPAQETVQLLFDTWNVAPAKTNVNAYIYKYSDFFI